MKVKRSSLAGQQIDGIEHMGTPSDQAYQEFKHGELSAHQLYTGWKRRLGLSFWRSFVHDLGFAVWAFLQMLRVLILGRVPEDMRFQPKNHTTDSVGGKQIDPES